MKQSTAIALPVQALDSSGDPVTGKVTGDWTKRISKDGGLTWSAMTATVTEGEFGWYSIALTSSHTDTVGILAVSLQATGVKQINERHEVTARGLDDLASSSALASAVSPLAQSTQVDALEAGMVDALLLLAGLPSASAIATAVWGKALDGAQTAQGLLIRSHAVLAGKATGLLGSLATFFRADGTTKAVEATQDVVAGTRQAPSTLGGD